MLTSCTTGCESVNTACQLSTMIVHARAAGSSAWNSPEDCLSLRAGVLRRQQRSVCSRHIDLMQFVSQSARITVDLCQEVFAERRWNCSSILRAPKFRRDLTAGITHGDSDGHRVINAWNSLSANIVTSPTVASFKYRIAKLKSMLHCCFYV